MKLCTIYKRVSTSSQAEEGVSLGAQEARARAWCQLQGHEVAGVYEDVMSGGKASNRKGLQAAMREVCKNRGILVVFNLSRLARSLPDAIQLTATLDGAGAALASMSESIDGNTSAGKLMLRMMMIVSEFQLDLIRENTRSALAHKRSKGERISRFAPFGFTLKDGMLTRDERQQGLIQTMIGWRVDGRTCVDIAEELNTRGHLSAQGGKWSASTVRKVLARSEKEAS